MAIRILLLEDSPPDARYIIECLRRFGHEVHHVTTLEAVLEALSGGGYDLALIDLCVDDSEGIFTFVRVRQAAGALPIIVQSGIAEEEVAVQALSSGAQDYVLKDRITPHGLNRAVKYALERKRIQAALEESEERYSLATRGARDGIWDWDLRQGKVWVSSRFMAMLGEPERELVISPGAWLGRVHQDDKQKLAEHIKAHLDGATSHLEIEYRIRHSSGEYRWILLRGLAVKSRGQAATRMAGSQSDITKRKETEEQLRYDALHDALTTLPNRALFEDRLRQALVRSRRRPDRHFAVLFLDLDRFKIINDSLGHLAGDELLTEIAGRLATSIRQEDTIARLGGDEFCILLDDVGPVSGAEVTATRIQKALIAPVRVSGQDVFTSASIGIAHSATGYDRPSDLMRDADVAMYRAKNQGGGCHVIFDPSLHGAALQRLRLEGDLRRAVESEQLAVHYQPILSLQTLELAGFEALVRWRCPRRGWVRPDQFIPVAEDTGLIVPLGYQVLRDACREVARLNAGRARPLQISVNLSPRQFRQPDFVEQVIDIVEEARLDPTCLTLEITEGMLMSHQDSVVKMLAELRRAGIRIDIDDFGTGYSSLAYLRRFPIDRLKIDRSFVNGMHDEDTGDLEIVRAILGLARSMGLEVVAEGIETSEQLRALEGMDCTYGQGYLFAKPQSAGAQLRNSCSHESAIRYRSLKAVAGARG